MGLFPPTGLEYIVTNMRDLVGEEALMDLRYEREYQNPMLCPLYKKKNITSYALALPGARSLRRSKNL